MAAMVTTLGLGTVVSGIDAFGWRSAAPVVGQQAWSPAAGTGRPVVSFAPSQGRNGSDVVFTTRASGQRISLTTAGFVAHGPTGGWLSFELVDADPNMEVVAQDPLSLGVGAAPGSVQEFASVRYRSAYPGIDVVFRGNGSRLEYDLVVAPGADPGLAELEVTGGSVGLDSDGGLEVSGARMLLSFAPPVLYQEVDGRRVEVPGAHELRGEDRYGFEVGDYDPTRPLVIDPVLEASSFLGGSGADAAYDLALAPDGSSVVVGFTESADFPVTGAAQGDLAGEGDPRSDAFVTKLAADGSGPVWSTYLGGSGPEAAFAVAVGPDGSVYVTGFTESQDFPVTGGFQPSYGGGDADIFITKLTPDGQVVYSSYLGGGGNDGPGGIAVTADGSAVVVGATSSIDFPVPNALFATPGGANDVDAFVARVAPDGSALTFSTYLGGAGDEHGVAVALDQAGDIYLAGDTGSGDFPVEGALQGSFGGSGTGLSTSFPDAFVVKMTGDGSRLVYSTYLGGADSEQATALAVDGQGQVYVTGNSGSAGFPVVAPFQARKGGDFDVFLTKLSADGSSAEFSTYLGGEGADNAEGVAVGPGGVFVVGSTRSEDFPTANSLQGRPEDRALNGFVAHFDPTGQSLVSSSYLGGGGDDQMAAAVIRAGAGPGSSLAATTELVIAGFTGSADFPVRGPFQEILGGGSGDVFIASLTMEALPATPGQEPAPESGGDRAWLLAGIAGTLLAVAVAHTLWLRSRDRRVPPAEPTRADQPVRMAGHVPRRGRLEARSADGRAFGEQRSAVLDDSFRTDAPDPGVGWGEESQASLDPGVGWDEESQASPDPDRTRGMDPVDWDDDAGTPEGESSFDKAFARFWDADEPGGSTRPSPLPSLEPSEDLGDAQDWLPSPPPPGSESNGGPAEDRDLGGDSWLPGGDGSREDRSPSLARTGGAESGGGEGWDGDDDWVRVARWAPPGSSPGAAEEEGDDWGGPDAPDAPDAPEAYWGISSPSPGTTPVSEEAEPTGDVPTGDVPSDATGDDDTGDDDTVSWYPDGVIENYSSAVEPATGVEHWYRSQPETAARRIPPMSGPPIIDPGLADPGFADLGRPVYPSPPEVPPTAGAGHDHDADEPIDTISVSDLLSENLPIPSDAARPEMSMRELLDEEMIPHEFMPEGSVLDPHRKAPPGPVPKGLFDPDPEDPLVQATQPPAEDPADGEDGDQATGKKRRKKG